MRTAVAFGAGIAIVGFELLALGLWARAGFIAPGYVFMTGPFPMIGAAIGALAQGAAGLILATRRPENRVGWVILGFAVLDAIAVALIASTALDPDGSRFGIVRWLAWFGGWFLFPGLSLIAFILAMIFPTGHFASRRWRVAGIAVAAWCAIAAVLIAIRPGPLLFFPLVVNPLAFTGATGAFTPSGPAALVYTSIPLLLLAGSCLTGGAALLWRYRMTTGHERVQVRWYIAAGVVLVATYSAELAGLLFLPPRDPTGELIQTLNNLALSLPPIAMTFAILRYRLYDIDTIISRAFVYGALTAVLAGIYTASIRLFNAIFTGVTGDTSDLSLVITTLILATTFTPIKARLERFVGRWLKPAEAGAPEAPADALAASLLDDPAVAAALDARIRAVLDERLADPPGVTRATAVRPAGASAARRRNSGKSAASH